MTPDPKPMTPAEFVARVEKHLPIGDYTRIECFATLAIVRIGTLDPTRGTCDLFLSDAANLLLGAVVEECHHFAVTHDAATPMIRVRLAIGLECNWFDSGWIHESEPFALLQAALLARAEARKAK